MDRTNDVAPDGRDAARGRDIADLVDDIDAIVWEADPATFAFTYVSKGAERMLGYPVDQWLTEPDFWPRHIHDDDRDTAVALCEAATRQGLDHEFGYRMFAADGSIHWMHDKVRVGTDAAGRVTRLRGVLFDKTAGNRAEQALRESEQRFRAVFESTSAGIVILTLEGRITAANQAAAGMLGYSVDEARGRSVVELAHPDEREETKKILGVIAAGLEDSITYEGRYVHRRGHTVTALVSATVVTAPASGVPYLVGQLHDVSERKALERRVNQSHKLEAVGRLAGGVAHDFNNMLLVVRSYADLLSEEFHHSDPRRADLGEIQKAADAGADLTRQLLAFSRQQVIEPRVIPIACLVANLERLLGRLIGEDITLITKCGDVPLSIRIDAGQLEQVIVNLAVNARDAMPSGGVLTIETALVTADTASEITAMGGLRGSFVMLSVTDTGVGMDTATRQRLFEPFFTTKPTGKGTGLGLATVHGIVHQNGGFIFVQSEQGKGASFRLYFPRADEAPDDRPTPAPEPADPRGIETVLLVEDSAPVRAATRQALERHGYHVIDAATGQAALDIAAVYGGVIHLLLTDVVMPGLNGRELARRFLMLRPEARVLYMSGYTDDTIIRHGVLEPGIAYLPKPFSPAALARKVRQVIDSPRQ